jgi:hypothetical protein
VRTGNQGYTLAICPTHMEIQLRGATEKDTTQLANWPDVQPGTGIVTVAIVDVGQTLTAYLNGVEAGSITNGAIAKGKIGLDALSENGAIGDVTFADTRVFYSAATATNTGGGGGGNTQPTYSPPKSPKPSTSAWPSTTPTTHQATPTPTS